MKNEIQLDHILVAVSDEEFEKYKVIAQSSDMVEYKSTIEKEWTWEACYVGLGDGLYLEIVKKSKYPSTIGIALSSLGEEKDLLSDLKLSYPRSSFSLEKAMKDDLHWYDGYFSEETETEFTFLWFMEYFNKFKKERSSLFPKNQLKEIVTINLTTSEVSDLTSVVENVPLNIKRDENTVIFEDSRNRAFKVCLKNEPTFRLSIE